MKEEARDILEFLERGELLHLAGQFHILILDRRARTSIIDSLCRTRSVSLGKLLGALPQARLKELCRLRGLDDSGREKDVLVARLLGLEGLSAQKANPEPTTQPCPEDRSLVQERPPMTNGPTLTRMPLTASNGSKLTLPQIDQHRSSGGPEIADMVTRLGFVLAGADDQISPQEITVIRAEARRRVDGLGINAHATLAASVEQLGSQNVDVDRMARDIKSRLSPDEQRQLLEHLFDIAVADGVFVPKEEQFLRQIAQHLDVDEAHFERLVRLCKVSVGSSPPPMPTGGPSRSRSRCVAQTTTGNTRARAAANRDDGGRHPADRPSVVIEPQCEPATPHHILALYQLLSGL
jgi:uncharacterized tellurite resistance protein B-like protein